MKEDLIKNSPLDKLVIDSKTLDDPERFYEKINEESN